MADITTFTRAKDWAIIVLIGFVISLLGIVAAENRDRISKLEEQNYYLNRQVLQSMRDRMTRIEVTVENLERYCRQTRIRSDRSEE